MTINKFEVGDFVTIKEYCPKAYTVTGVGSINKVLSWEPNGMQVWCVYSSSPVWQKHKAAGSFLVNPTYFELIPEELATFYRLKYGGVKVEYD